MKVIMEFDLSDLEKDDELRLKQAMKANDMARLIWDIRECIFTTKEPSEAIKTILEFINDGSINLEELYP